MYFAVLCLIVNVFIFPQMLEGVGGGGGGGQ